VVARQSDFSFVLGIRGEEMGEGERRGEGGEKGERRGEGRGGGEQKCMRCPNSRSPQIWGL
jgi:hypothetical protein